MNKIRGLILAFSSIALFLALFFFVQFTNFLFNIQQKYADSPTWLIVLYIGGISIISLVGVILLYKLSKFGSHSQEKEAEKKREIVDDKSFNDKIELLKNQGADTNEIESDWENLLKTRKKEAVTIALFGEINAGKSSLIKALTGKDSEISAKGGKTQAIIEYPLNYNHRSYELIDMPGLNEAGKVGFSENLIKEKAIKSHIVVWVMDEEITQSAYENYQALKEFKKPIIIAINKSDYYSNKERLSISERIQSQLTNDVPVVWTSSATQKIVERHYEDGRIESKLIEKEANLNELITTIESLTFDRLTLDSQLNDSYFKQLEIDINISLAVAREAKAEKIIKSYSQKAIFGGMAAVGPGTDVLLQGYLGVGMAKALCQVYDVDVKSVDLDSTLTLLNDKMQKEMTLILALIGNVFKAFPGIGTVAGGIAHAIAYGLIFESVGKAMVTCLRENNQFDKKMLANELQKQISNDIEQRALRLAKTVIFKKIK